MHRTRAATHQDDITTDSDFAPYLENLTVIGGYDELPGLLGGVLRYKLEHHLPNGKVDTKYRIGGILTYVGGDYITLKNAKAERRGSYGKSWSVQLRLSKPDRNNPGTWVPIFPLWVCKTNMAEVSAAARASSTGVIILTLWGSPPMSREYNQMKALLQRLDPGSSMSKAPGMETPTVPKGLTKPDPQADKAKTLRPSNFHAMF